MHDKGAYRLEARPFAVGGQAELFRARRKEDDQLVVFKRRIGQGQRERTRLRREVEVQLALMRKDLHVMPVLDWDDASFRWYVMPLGEVTLEQVGSVPANMLIDVVRSLLSALRVAHALDNPHRDLKPSNVIYLIHGQDAPRWVLADWGITRRPLGKTTAPLTSVGQLIGTDGYAAPEAYTDGHTADGRADLYSLGQLIGWALTGNQPIPNVQPKVSGPWRSIVRRLTQIDPKDRYRNCDEVADAMESILGISSDPVRDIERLVTSGKQHDAVSACLRALEIADNHDILLDRIAPLVGVARSIVTSHRGDAVVLVKAMVEAFDSFGRRDFNYANVPLRFMHQIAEASADAGDIDLLEDVCAALFPIESRWDRFGQRDLTAAWLRTLRGDAAEAVAHCIAAVPQMKKYLGAAGAAVPGAIGAALRRL